MLTQTRLSWHPLHSSPSFLFVAVLFTLLLALTPRQSPAVVLVSQTFTTNNAAGWSFGGSGFTACLTANGGANSCSVNNDANGSGWLRLSDDNSAGNEEGYAYYGTSFAANQGFVIDFDFASYGGSGADGFVMFLEDASATFRPGDVGGAMSYTNGCNVAGMRNGWIGIAFDEWGNFSNPGDRCKSGGPGQTPSSVVIRGQGNYGGSGSVGTNYNYLTGNQTSTALDCPASDPGLSGPTPDLCTTRPATTGVDFRHARITIELTGGVWQVYVDVQFGAGAAYTRVVPAYTLPNPPYTNLRIGFAASTGGYTNFHEIRNLTITNPVDTSLTKTVSTAVAAPGTTFSYTLNAANSTLSAATGVKIVDTLPSLVSYQSYAVGGALTTSNGGGTTTCSFTSPKLTCTVGTLATSATGTVTVNVKALTGGANNGTTETNTATISQNDLDVNQNNNTGTASNVVYAAPGVTIVKTANVSNPAPGSAIVYTIQSTNSAGPANSNVLTDAMSPFTALSINYAAAGQPFQFNAGATGLTMGTPQYSKDHGATWTYTLTSGAGGAPAGYDGVVTNFRIPLTGTMAGGGTTYSVVYSSLVK